MNPSRPRAGTARRATLAMWAAIAGAAWLLVALLTAGWGQRAWGIAAGALLVACLAVCVWAAIAGERASRDVGRAAEHLAEERRRLRQPG